jgi:hypothetical protein
VLLIPTRQMRCVPIPMGIGPGPCTILNAYFREHLFYALR